MLGAPLLNDREDLLAVLIEQHELRSQEVRAAQLSAARVGAVARRAVDAVERAAALDDRRIGQRTLHRGKDAALSAALPWSCCRGGRLRRRVGRRRWRLRRRRLRRWILRPCVGDRDRQDGERKDEQTVSQGHRRPSVELANVQVLEAHLALPARVQLQRDHARRRTSAPDRCSRVLSPR